MEYWVLKIVVFKIWYFVWQYFVYDYIFDLKWILISCLKLFVSLSCFYFSFGFWR